MFSSLIFLHITWLKGSMILASLVHDGVDGDVTRNMFFSEKFNGSNISATIPSI